MKTRATGDLHLAPTAVRQNTGPLLLIFLLFSAAAFANDTSKLADLTTIGSPAFPAHDRYSARSPVQSDQLHLGPVIHQDNWIVVLPAEDDGASTEATESDVPLQPDEPTSEESDEDKPNASKNTLVPSPSQVIQILPPQKRLPSPDASASPSATAARKWKRGPSQSPIETPSLASSLPSPPSRRRPSPSATATPVPNISISASALPTTTPVPSASTASASVRPSPSFKKPEKNGSRTGGNKDKAGTPSPSSSSEGNAVDSDDDIIIILPNDGGSTPPVSSSKESQTPTVPDVPSSAANSKAPSETLSTDPVVVFPSETSEPSPSTTMSLPEVPSPSESASFPVSDVSDPSASPSIGVIQIMPNSDGPNPSSSSITLSPSATASVPQASNAPSTPSDNQEETSGSPKASSSALSVLPSLTSSPPEATMVPTVTPLPLASASASFDPAAAANVPAASPSSPFTIVIPDAQPLESPTDSFSEPDSSPDTVDSEVSPTSSDDDEEGKSPTIIPNQGIISSIPSVSFGTNSLASATPGPVVEILPPVAGIPSIVPTPFGSPFGTPFASPTISSVPSASVSASSFPSASPSSVPSFVPFPLAPGSAATGSEKPEPVSNAADSVIVPSTFTPGPNSSDTDLNIPPDVVPQVDTNDTGIVAGDGSGNSTLADEQGSVPTIIAGGPWKNLMGTGPSGKVFPIIMGILGALLVLILLICLFLAIFKGGDATYSSHTQYTQQRPSDYGSTQGGTYQEGGTAESAGYGEDGGQYGHDGGPGTYGTGYSGEGGGGNYNSSVRSGEPPLSYETPAPGSLGGGNGGSAFVVGTAPDEQAAGLNSETPPEVDLGHVKLGAVTGQDEGDQTYLYQHPYGQNRDQAEATNEVAGMDLGESYDNAERELKPTYDDQTYGQPYESTKADTAHSQEYYDDQPESNIPYVNDGAPIANEAAEYDQAGYYDDDTEPYADHQAQAVANDLNGHLEYYEEQTESNVNYSGGETVGEDEHAEYYAAQARSNTKHGDGETGGVDEYAEYYATQAQSSTNYVYGQAREVDEHAGYNNGQSDVAHDVNGQAEYYGEQTVTANYDDVKTHVVDGQPIYYDEQTESNGNYTGHSMADDMNEAPVYQAESNTNYDREATHDTYGDYTSTANDDTFEEYNANVYQEHPPAGEGYANGEESAQHIPGDNTYFDYQQATGQVTTQEMTSADASGDQEEYSDEADPCAMENAYAEDDKYIRSRSVHFADDEQLHEASEEVTEASTTGGAHIEDAAYTSAGSDPAPSPYEAGVAMSAAYDSSANGYLSSDVSSFIGAGKVVGMHQQLEERGVADRQAKNSGVLRDNRDISGNTGGMLSSNNESSTDGPWPEWYSRGNMNETANLGTDVNGSDESKENLSVQDGNNASGGYASGRALSFHRGKGAGKSFAEKLAVFGTNGAGNHSGKERDSRDGHFEEENREVNPEFDYLRKLREPYVKSVAGRLSVGPFTSSPTTASPQEGVQGDSDREEEESYPTAVNDANSRASNGWIRRDVMA